MRRSRFFFQGTASVTDQHWSVRHAATTDTASTAEHTTVQRRLAALYSLLRPEGIGPFPAVMLVPACRGFSPSARGHEHNMDMARRLHAQGYVVLFVDYLGTRDLASCREGVSHDDVAHDVMTAASYLRTLPFVKASAINVIGRWFGGDEALAVLSLMEKTSPPAIQAVVAYHPACRHVKPWQANIPVLTLTGALDDVNPVADCHALRAKLPADAPVTVRALPAAHAAFDYPGLPPIRKRATGGHVGYNPHAAAAAWQEVQQFLQR